MTDRRAGLMAVTALAMAALCALSVPSLARVYKGSGKANKVTGTKKGDRISLRGGNDRARGRGGNDRISGGRGKDRLRGDSGKDRLSGNAGNDRLHGGKGRDRLNGGTGNDVLNAVDGKRDASVNGGKGRNTCRVDNADLKVVKRCSKLIVAKPRAGAPGGAGGKAGGSGTAGAAHGDSTADPPLAVTEAEGLTCGSSLPTCRFSLSGDGADTTLGQVSGEGGVEPAAGPTLSIEGEDWLAEGIYGCTSNGSLRVDIGSETIRVPVTCTSGG